MRPVTLGLRAMKGGAAMICVEANATSPRAVFSTFLATSEGSDRLSFEPYTLGFELAASDDAGSNERAIDAVKTGTKRQVGFAKKNLEAKLIALKSDGFSVGGAGLLVNRAGWVTDLIEYGLSSPEHAAVAEGLSVRDALRSAMRALKLSWIEIDEKSIESSVGDLFSISPSEINTMLKRAGKEVGRPWRTEQKLAYLAAWLITASED